MKKAISMVALAFMLNTANASNIDIYEFSSFINADEIAGDSLIDRQIFNPGLSPENTFGLSGLSVGFNNGLNADNTGTVSWTITNNSGINLNNVQFFGFLDAEIDEPLNTFFNESGSQGSLSLGSGSGDAKADSWQIGDPFFDNIFLDLLDGILTNSNTVPAGSENDVSLALGFDIGTLLAGESFSVAFNISLIDNGGLMHFDPDSNDGFFFNGLVQNLNEVPIPATWLLFGVGLLGVRLFSSRD